MSRLGYLGFARSSLDCYCTWEGVAGRNGPQRRVPKDGSLIAGRSREDTRTSSLKTCFAWHHRWYHVVVRIVLDTASFVTAVRSSDGAAGEVVRMIFREELVPLMDLKLGLEYRDVALRAEHVGASALSKREILELIEAVEAFAEPVEVVIKARPLSPDPNDDMILDLAINGRAEALVTSNTKHFAGAGKRFGIPVLSPAELLEKMREGN
jgi:putative PIN family toxin of toxin-antitoxin system